MASWKRDKNKAIRQSVYFPFGNTASAAQKDKHAACKPF